MTTIPPASAPSPADTDQVLASIGVTAEQVARLREHGVV